MLAAGRCCLDQEPPSRLANVLWPTASGLRLWAGLVVCLCGVIAGAAPPKLEYTLDGVSPLAEKRIEAAEDFLSAKQWDEAFRLLDEVLREYRRDLVEAEPGRWVSVPRRVSEITAALEPEGLAAYRQRVDAQASELFREAEAAGDVPRLERLVTEFFASTPAEGALWRLGERYWQAGEIAAARDVWRSLIAEGMIARNYPSPTMAQPLVWARVALCHLLLNDIDSANGCVGRLYDNFPDATGTIGGREGLLKELILETIEERRAHRPAGGGSAPWQGAGSAAETRVNGLRWSSAGGAVPSFGDRVVQEVPAAWSNVLLASTNDRVRALDLRTGRPAWPSGKREDDGSVFETDPAPLTDPWPRPLHRPAIGDGVGFVRLGVGGKPNRLSLLQNDTSRIVALDLKAGEGKLLWSTMAGDLDRSQSWGFASSPVVSEDRVLAVVRTPGTESQLGVACLSARTGQRLWLRAVGTVLSEADPLWGREVLVAASGRIVLNVAGLVALLRLDDGSVEWVVRESRREGAGEPGSDLTATIVPLVEKGTIYAVVGPRTAACLDWEDGRREWTAEFDDEIEAAVARGERIVAFAGRSLTGVHIWSGKPMWRLRFPDAGMGPGWQAGRDLFWSTNEDLLTVDLARGSVVHRVPLPFRGERGREGIQGGWLSGAAGSLILAAPAGLRVFEVGPSADGRGATR
ncbi:Outer membrane protein assembly factor BamB [Planctomyces sp. SH-PL14]|nr:Outer membrane protein assembly factor BamB [Planctomyces sp. SH-PL14]